MTLPPLTEKQFMAQVVELAHALGYRVAHFRPAQTTRGWRTPVSADGAGWPDLFLVKGARAYAMELKAKGKKPTPEQREWLAALSESGIPSWVFYPDEFEEIVRILQGGSA